MTEHRTLIVSFSGIDGAGKSTQIAMLRSWLEETGLRSFSLSFWDDVAALSRLRELASHSVFRGEKGVGSPGNPVRRRDKNVQSWPATLLRLCLYFLDALHLSFVVARAKAGGADVVIFDRYLYDELANLPLRKRFAGAYARLLVKLAPRPDVAYLIDTDPVLARRRKPEYPVEFLEQNRDSFLALADMAGITAISSASPVEMQWRVVEELVKKLPSHKREFFIIAKAAIES